MGVMAAPDAAPPAARTLLQGWWTGFVGWRNRLLAEPGFQRFAARFPLTRPIAQARANRLFEIATGFVHARVLFAVVKLGLIELLADGPMPPLAIARTLDLPPARLLVLLKAAASIELLQALPDGRFTLGELGAAMRANPGLPDMVEHHSLLYADLADPLALVRGDGPATAVASYWPYAAGAEDSAAAETYSSLMGRTQAMLAGYVTDAVGFARFRRVMDVGGGEGVFIEAVSHAAPRCRLTLFDLPDVAARARRRLKALGLEQRISVEAGSFLTDALPLGADCITLNRILHDHDDAPAMTLLRAARAALAEDGALVIAEPLADTPGARPMGHGYFGLYLLAMGSGRPRTRDEVTAMLRDAGFGQIRELPSAQPGLVRILEARA